MKPCLDSLSSHSDAQNTCREPSKIPSLHKITTFTQLWTQNNEFLQQQRNKHDVFTISYTVSYSSIARGHCSSLVTHCHRVQRVEPRASHMRHASPHSASDMFRRSQAVGWTADGCAGSEACEGPGRPG